jgi:divalent metal cation (Fe/Co/Zn/Cd) transporter
MFYLDIIESRSFRVPIVVIAVIQVSFAAVNYFLIQKESINSYSSVMESFIIVVLSIAYYYTLLKQLPARQLQELPLFWIVSALFFSSAGKLVIYAVTHYLIHIVQSNLIFIWTFHNFLSIICNLVIAYGAWLNLRQFKSISLSQ